MKNKKHIIIDKNKIETLIGQNNNNNELINLLSQRTNGIFDIDLLYSLGINDDELFRLWDSCCKRNITVFSDTLVMFRQYYYKEDEIHDNLTSNKPIPFIDESIPRPIPSKEIESDNIKWYTYYQENRSLFIERKKEINKNKQSTLH